MIKTTSVIPWYEHLRPEVSAKYIVRVTSAYALLCIACKICSGYAHLCNAGTKWIELPVMIGVPLICLALILLIKRLWIGIPLAAILIVAAKLLCQPYLDFIHGPNSPWPAYLN